MRITKLNAGRLTIDYLQNTPSPCQSIQNEETLLIFVKRTLKCTFHGNTVVGGSIDLLMFPSLSEMQHFALYQGRKPTAREIEIDQL